MKHTHTYVQIHIPSFQYRILPKINFREIIKNYNPFYESSVIMIPKFEKDITKKECDRHYSRST